ncbi:MAG: hypothetical protein SGJ10_11940 [Bacteroidota bacterium]|nr:hypothetical protein [Bacteroidota bacterium]
MSTINLITPLLRNKEETISRMLYKVSSGKEITRLLSLSIAMFAVFGFLIGASQGIEQTFSSAVKLPLLFYFTSFICFPTLFFFMLFFGAKQHFNQLLSFIVLCNTYIALV